MQYRRMPIEIESPEQMGYENIKYNLTESSFTDTWLKDISLNLDQLLLCYGDHRGLVGLRKLIAQEEKNLTPDHVLITAGAASALFIIATSFLKQDDHMIVLKPNYATNIETPRALGCKISFLPLLFEEHYQLNVEKLRSLIQPKTKLISLTYPHNPTGMTLSPAELKELIKIAEDRNIILLMDETYRDMSFVAKPPLAASLSSQVISVSSLSKSYGLPGIRIGWIVSQNSKWMETFLAAKEQIFICNSVLDEEIAFRYLDKKAQFWPGISKKIQETFNATKEWMAQQEFMEWIEPRGGCVCFPRIKKSAKVDIDKFYQILNSQTKTYVGPGHWFEEDRHSMRIGYAWPSLEELKQGLKNIETSLINSRKSR